VPLLFEPGFRALISSFALEPQSGHDINTTGAGDTFVGALLVALSTAEELRCDFQTVVRLAHAAANARIVDEAYTLPELLKRLPHYKAARLTNRNLQVT
jgi:sugar/nucleoside kinase (ribokinase family)